MNTFAIVILVVLVLFFLAEPGVMCVVLGALAVTLALIFGYINNIIILFHIAGDQFFTEIVAWRIFGIIMPPVGVVMGYL